jgi:Archaeal fructose-1,6-bisphosphatase and related enzymes of inositol monophosphatase family
MPAWGTLIALTRGGEPVYGMMHQPFTRERFTGDSNAARYRGTGRRPRAAGAALRQARRRDSDDDKPAVDGRPADRAAFGQVEQAVKLSRYGGDCYAYCMLAAGHVDLVIETELKPYDILPLIPIILGAGGMVTGWDGGSPTAGGRIIAAGDQRVHEAAMALLNK